MLHRIRRFWSLKCTKLAEVHYYYVFITMQCFKVFKTLKFIEDIIVRAVRYGSTYYTHTIKNTIIIISSPTYFPKSIRFSKHLHHFCPIHVKKLILKRVYKLLRSRFKRILTAFWVHFSRELHFHCFPFSLRAQNTQETQEINALNLFAFS